MSFLVTGWSGTGKSTICKELLKKGVEAIDTDRVNGLCSWVSKETGEKYGTKCPEPFTSGKYDWNWDETILQKNLDTYKDAVFCGSANNALRFFDLFSKVFVLNLSEHEQRRRMTERTEHNFGQDIETQNAVILGQANLVKDLTKMGAHVICATPPPPEIALTIISKINED